MITNDPNTNLIEAMKEKLPLKGKLADMLMDTLYIGKEAVYRRLRGEVPFTTVFFFQFHTLHLQIELLPLS